MLNYVGTVHPGTTVSLFPVSSTGKEQETGPVPSPTIHLSEYVWLRIGKKAHYSVPPLLKEGYLAACKAYTEMDEHDPNGVYIFLTGYEYAHLARQYMPANLPRAGKREWHRGFVLGWNACTFCLQEDEESTKRASRAVDPAGWPLDL